MKKLFDMEEKDEAKKGPWTEQEDVQLVFYVNLFGDRRWDFIAKVSGLKRTGKSCRLRWVNYLHPGLKRVKMTPHEERLVVELHSKWGNRWSRIARKLPGRTDNEIKNYWRTHMRKKAQEKKKAASMSPSSSSSNSSSSSSSTSNSHITKTKERTFFDTGGVDAVTAVPGGKKTGLEVAGTTKTYSLDEIWKDIEENCNLTCHTMVSPIWDFPPTDESMLLSMDEEHSKTFTQPMGDDYFNSFPYYNHMIG